MRSGRDYDKFQTTGLTPGKCSVVSAPLVEESPLSLECRIKEIVALGSHHLMIADIVNLRADTGLIDPTTGKFDLEQAHLLTYVHGAYYGIGDKIGKFGWSVEKKANRN